MWSVAQCTQVTPAITFKSVLWFRNDKIMSGLKSGWKKKHIKVSRPQFFAELYSIIVFNAYRFFKVITSTQTVVGSFCVGACVDAGVCWVHTAAPVLLLEEGIMLSWSPETAHQQTGQGEDGWAISQEGKGGVRRWGDVGMNGWLSLIMMQGEGGDI